MSIDTIARAIDLARGLSWFDDYTRWATAWLDGSDRSRESAHLAVARVRQWVEFRRRIVGDPLLLECRRRGRGAGARA